MVSTAVWIYVVGIRKGRKGCSCRIRERKDAVGRQRVEESFVEPGSRRNKQITSTAQSSAIESKGKRELVGRRARACVSVKCVSRQRHRVCGYRSLTANQGRLWRLLEPLIVPVSLTNVRVIARGTVYKLKALKTRVKTQEGDCC